MVRRSGRLRNVCKGTDGRRQLGVQGLGALAAAPVNMRAAEHTQGVLFLRLAVFGAFCWPCATRRQYCFDVFLETRTFPTVSQNTVEIRFTTTIKIH